MPKKPNEEIQKLQSERFLRAVRDMVDAGELSPTEADAAFDRIMDRVKGKLDKGIIE